MIIDRQCVATNVSTDTGYINDGPASDVDGRTSAARRGGGEITDRFYIAKTQPDRGEGERRGCGLTG